MMTGFVLTTGNKHLFYVSDGKNITSSIVEKFVDKIGELRNLTSEYIARCKADSYTMKDLKRRIDRATLEKVDTGKIEYYKMSGKYFIHCIPLDEAECLIVFE